MTPAETLASRAPRSAPRELQTMPRADRATGKQRARARRFIHSIGPAVLSAAIVLALLMLATPQAPAAIAGAAAGLAAAAPVAACG